MSFLLDSHVVVWWLTDSPRLGPHARNALFEQGAELVVSLASVWELAAKASRGSLPLPAPIVPQLVASLSGKARLIGITTAHLEVLEALPRHHGDPFDRMLIAQAIVEQLTLVTADQAIGRYALPLLDASG